MKQYDKKLSAVLHNCREFSAITQTIAEGVDTDLAFQINGEEYTAKTFAEKFGKEGYTVTFKYDFESNETEKAGKVNTDKDFKYAVEVKDKTGKAVNEVTAEDFQTVSVKSTAVASVEKVALSNKLDYTTAGTDNVKFVAVEGTTGLGKEATKEQLSALTVESAISDNLAVASYEDGIVAKKPGTATFTVKFAGIKEAVKVTVEVKAEAVATSIEAADQKIKTTANYSTENVKVLDQYGVELTGAPVTYKAYDKDNKEVADNTLVGKEAGTYTVKVTAEIDGEEKQIGSFKVETVAVTDTVKPDKYEASLVKNEDKTLDSIDLNPAVDDKGETTTPKTVTINVKGSYQGIELTGAEFDQSLFAKSSNKNFEVEPVLVGEKGSEKLTGAFTVALVDGASVKAGDTTTITFYTKKGDVETKVATPVEVKVVNTTPQIKSLTLAEDAKVLTTENATTEALANVKTAFDKATVAPQVVAKDADSKVFKDFSQDQIASVEFENRVVNTKDKKVTGDVTVTLEAAYGGESFTFKGEVEFTKTNAQVNQEAAEAEAEAAVAKAESSKKQEDVDAAQKLVTALTDGEAKTAFQNRLDATQAEINKTAQATAQTAAGTLNSLSVATDAKSLTLTFANDYDAKKIVDVEKFLNDNLQFQVASIKADGLNETGFAKFDKSKGETGPEAKDLTPAQVKTVLSTFWNGTVIDWSKVKVAQGTDTTNGAKQIVLTVGDNLISAADLKGETKLNSTSDTGYKISFAKKDDTASTHKLVLVAADSKVTTTFITK